MPSIYETPQAQRSYPGMFATPASAVAPQQSSSTLYPDLPSELRTPVRSYSHSSPPIQSYSAPQDPPPQQQRTSLVPRPVEPTATGSDIITPAQRAAKIVSETLDAERRYPQLDDIVSQGQSAEYDLPVAVAAEPFMRTAMHTIPDAIFEQYNRATSHTLMGLFAELKQAWITVDNRLYLWDYTTQTGFQGYESQPNTITCVRLLTPKKGVFVASVNYVLVIATTVELVLLGVEATENAHGVYEVTLYETKMTVPTRGLDVTIIEGSQSTGRIFFAGKADNEIYELTYQAEERWFHGRCGKVCHTNQGSTAFVPRIPYFSAPKDTECVEQIVIDDTRNLLYSLSSSSKIRAFQIRTDGGLKLSLTHSFSHTLANIRVMVGNTPYLGPDTPIISISAVSQSQARRTHLIATTKSGCRLFMSAVASEYGFGGTDAAPTSMQVIHIRYPPKGSDIQNNVRRATVITPGYFFCFHDRGNQYDDLFLAAPDPAKILNLAENAAARVQLIEQGMVVPLESRVEACEVVSGAFAAQKSPTGFGNELATQFDLGPTEVAILTNSGVHVVRRRRLVEIFDATLRFATATSEAEVRRFFDTYGRAEGCASALAVACGAGVEDTAVQGNLPSRVTDNEVFDAARKYFIEFGGKPSADNVYDSAALPSLDSIKVSGRAEGLALYIARIVRSIWRSYIIAESISVAGGVTYVSSAPIPKLRGIQQQLVTLGQFLQENRGFIVGLSGAESLMVAVSKIEEVANQAEHRALHSLVSLIENMVEGISFVLFLLDDKLDDIILSLPDQQREAFKKISYGQLFSSSAGQNLAKELVTAIVNRNIAAGMNVDTIADALRRRCGSFCSADDVVVFKAVEQVRRAKDEQDSDMKIQLLRESLRLFEETAASLTMDNLTETVSEFRGLGYYQGAVQLALTVAKEVDRGNLALQFLDEAPGPGSPTEAAQLYEKRVECYRLVFRVLEDLERTQGNAPLMIDGVPSPAFRIRNETWQIVYSSGDDLFHYCLYDWLFERGQAEKLLDVDSPFVLSYLRHRGSESLAHCDLLWQYHRHRDDFFEAAQVLHELAKSEFSITLDRRLEYFSRARGFCQSQGAFGMRTRMNELARTIGEELDIAVAQEEILRRVRDDPRISAPKKAKLEAQLCGGLIGLSELYNRYAEPYGYMDICLSIFQSADYRSTTEIRKCWEQLISQIHENALSDPNSQAAPFELVAETVRRLGNRFIQSEYVFPPSEIISLLEIYSYEHQRDAGTPGWVIMTLCEAGVSEETILRVLEEMFWRDEVPFTGMARKRLLADAVLAAEMWWSKALKRGATFGDVVPALKSMVQVLGPKAQEEAVRIEKLEADVARRGGVS